MYLQNLKGHSYGCNKVLYYYNHKKDDSIKKIVLLAPCDIPSEGKKFLNEEEYKKAKEESTRLVQENKENELIDFFCNG
jgi:predicted alpha/beta hydrolase family esterase